MLKLSASAKIYNLSFGRVVREPIEFTWASPELSLICNKEVVFNVVIGNDKKLFEAENELKKYHSQGNKQRLAHNFRAAAVTGNIVVHYEDFPADLAYDYVEIGNNFLGGVIAAILSFLQRRRVVIGIVRFMPSQNTIYAMPPFFAGEFVDSVAFGPEAFCPDELGNVLVSAKNNFLSLGVDQQQKVKMLLRRHNEILNLPYIHERVEGLWRVIESLGKKDSTSIRVNPEYLRLKKICGIKSTSKNLERLATTLFDYDISYDDGEVRDSFEFRNIIMHDFLNPKLPMWEGLEKVFYFLNRCVDEIICHELGISSFKIIAARYDNILGRLI